MEQGTLTFDRVAGTGPCAFGGDGDAWDGPHHCERCAAAVEAACREFDAMVARGEYDENGYTPSEAKAARKRGTYRGVIRGQTEPRA